MGPKFPSGFASWLETHYEMVVAIHSEHIRDDYQHIAPMVEGVHDTGGLGFLYGLSRLMTDEFEEIHKDTVWGEDGQPEYYPTIEKFCADVLAEKFDHTHRYWSLVG